MFVQKTVRGGVEGVHPSHRKVRDEWGTWTVLVEGQAR